MQSRKDIRLVLRTGFIFERDAGEEHAVALLGQLVIDVLRHEAVAGAGTGFIGFFVTDEHIERLLVL